MYNSNVTRMIQYAKSQSGQYLKFYVTFQIKCQNFEIDWKIEIK